jgi:hypothetical protein
MANIPLSENRKRYVFIRQSNIGVADALHDTKYLAAAFFDTGDLNILKDTEDPRAIVVGRTGAGKTALLAGMQWGKSSVIPIDPRDIGIDYVASRPFLKSLIEIDVNLDQFYRMLWRRVFIGELLQPLSGCLTC